MDVTGPGVPELFMDEGFQVAQEDAFAYGLRHHHMLDDAKALAAAWTAVNPGVL